MSTALRLFDHKALIAQLMPAVTWTAMGDRSVRLTAEGAEKLPAVSLPLVYSSRSRHGKSHVLRCGQS